MPGVTLPEFGGAEQHFEDTVAALFAAAGYVVQRRLRMRDPDELLELDTVATDYQTDPPRTIVIECKSGARWGWNDLLRLLGRMRFLGIPEGALFAKSMPGTRSLDGTNRRLAPHNTKCILLPDDADLASVFVGGGFTNEIDVTRLSVWRFVFALERAMIGRIEGEAKANRKKGDDQRAANYLVRYYEQINSGIFFEPNLYRRLQRLYDLWQDSPRLSLGCAIEVAGGVFDASAPPDPKNGVIAEALYHGKHELVQAAMFIEHRARLAVLKAVIDLIIAGTLPQPVFLVKGAPALTEWNFLPSNVRNAIGILSQRPAFQRYAVFWQQYLWSFGGFTLADRQQQEFALLSAASGVPEDAVVDALSCFDRLFPLGNEWHRKAGNSQCRVLLMVPTPFQGLGAFHRKLRYGVESYADLKYADYTIKDLSKWHEVGLGWLQRHGDLPSAD